MSRLKIVPNSSGKSTPTARVIFVGTDTEKREVTSKFALKNNLEFTSYTEQEWATLDEIDQYIQEEELSKQITHLPVGFNQDISLDSITKQHIKKVLRLKKLNVNEVAKTLKISRATLYRKLEKTGMDLKKERQDLLKKAG